MKVEIPSGSEIKCRLCGVHFQISRIRTINEPKSAAFVSKGEGSAPFVKPSSECGPSTGCSVFSEMENVFIPLTADSRQSLPRDAEHISGPACKSVEGYSGIAISVGEMRGCNTAQCLVQKDATWESEPGDGEFEIKDICFLSGICDYSGAAKENRHRAILKTTPKRHNLELQRVNHHGQVGLQNYYSDLRSLTMLARSTYRRW